MSKKITINLGPRNPKDEDRIIKAVIRSMPDNCEILFNASQQQQQTPTANAPAPRTMGNEALEKKIEDTVGASLEKRNDELDQRAAQAPKNNDPIAAAEKKAEAIVTAQRQMKSWRQIVNEAGWKIVIEAVLKEAWNQRIEIGRSLKEAAEGILRDMFI